MVREIYRLFIVFKLVVMETKIQELKTNTNFMYASVNLRIARICSTDTYLTQLNHSLELI
jgi:hypothetical protein